jgi:8-oxo-dGTP diphosphatase
MRGICQPNVYLLLEKEGKFLLSLRHNTGYQDGMYGLVSGHVEDGESATHAMIREAKEEIGVLLYPENLSIVHIMHRKSDRNNLDIFIHTTYWKGKIVNNEPHKCNGITFHAPENFPSNTLDYIKVALHHAQEGTFYSEMGWRQ